MYHYLFIYLALLLILTGCGDSEYSDPVSDASEDHATVDELINEADRLTRNGALEEARDVIARSREIAESLEYDEGLLHSYVELGNLHIRQGRADSALTVLEDAKSRFDDVEPDYRVYNVLATAHRFLENYTEALQYYLQAIDLVEQQDVDDEQTLAGLEHNIGVVYAAIGERSEAIERYHHAMEYSAATRDTSLKVVVTNSIGNLSLDRDDYENADYYLNLSKDLALASGADSDLVNAYLNLGNLYKETGSKEEALEMYDSGFEVAERIGDRRYPILMYYNKGSLYQKHGDAQLAREYYERSLEKSREFGINEGLIRNNMGLGELVTQEDDFQSALSYYGQALNIAENMQSLEHKQEVHRRLSKTYENLGDFESAYQSLEKSKLLADSLADEKRDLALARYQTELGLIRERGERDLLEQQLQGERALLILSFLSVLLIGGIAIALYRIYRRKKAINKNLEAKQTELKEANKTKDKLLGILSHDLRGPIANLQGMVTLIHEDALQQKDMAEITTRIDEKLMRTLTSLNNYLNWSLTQQDGFDPNIQSVKIHELGNDVLEIAQSNADKKGIILKNYIPEELIADVDPNMARVILINLVSNAIKFSNSGDEVTLEGEEMAGKTILRVVDSGVGIDEQDQQHLFKAINQGKPGTNNESGTGFGLSLCKEFTDRLGGNIYFESKPEKGTVFFVELPSGEKQKTADTESTAFSGT